MVVARVDPLREWIERRIAKGGFEIGHSTTTQPASVGNTTAGKKDQKTAAQLLIRSLVQQDVKYIFGHTGWKDDADL